MEQQDQRSQSQSQSPFGPFNSAFRAVRRNSAAFSELVLSPTQAVTATIGTRGSRSRTGRGEMNTSVSSGVRSLLGRSTMVAN